ncbi:MAG: phosphatidyl-myo-inositol alpha-mannosyltransferase [Frankiaceae bacterium]|jgi:phosphatidylinositol alpha-mannosyltransferase|nr:phosphatidyl-myo-inositol alpha-mannosyltransferase [Frankiaceae bacterium]
MRVGIACPYTWDVPGGVQAHVRDLAENLIALGHEVSVITPADDESTLPPYAVHAGKAVAVPYNGSVARLLVGPVSLARVHRWLRDHDFDVLHVHEPTAPSISVMATMLSPVPVVATFHTSNPRSKILAAMQIPAQIALEKIQARIAVSEAARRTIVEHLGVDGVLIPNGVDVASFAHAEPLAGWTPTPERRAIGFLGRIDEPRKGLSVLLEALPRLVRAVPDVRLLVAGPGDVEETRRRIPPALRDRVELLGLVSEDVKPRVFRSVDVYCAPNTGQESFGIILLEAMAADTPVVASDIDAFRRVLDDGRAGHLFGVGDPVALAAALIAMLADPAAREAVVQRGREVVAVYDWPVVTQAIVQVYEAVAGVLADPAAPSGRR